jgi:ribokinase
VAGNPKICVVGSVNVDLTFRTSRLPRAGETLAGEAFHLGFGGKGANQAVMASRLGAQVTLVARVGNDAFGRESLSHLHSCKLDTSHVRIDADRSTGTAAIIVDAQAQNCILVVPGANLGLSPDDVRAAAPAIQSAGALLCQLEVPIGTTLAAFRLAKGAGVPTVLNPAPAAPLPAELLELTDLCVPNETELESLTGQPVADLQQVEAAARALRTSASQTVIVTLGERGALVLDSAGVEHIPVAPVAAVDPTGAGDAFIGSLAVFWSEAGNLREAIRRANAVAALTVTRPGAQSAFPTRAEAEAAIRVS